MDYVTVNVRQPPLDAVVVKAQALVIEPERVENGRVEIIHRRHILDRLVAEVVGSTVDIAGLYAAPCHPDTEGMGVVVTTKEFGTASFFVHGGTPELATPDDEGFFEETTLFEVSEECRDRLVGLFTFFG